jgi:hypothetical protein
LFRPKLVRPVASRAPGVLRAVARCVGGCCLLAMLSACNAPYARDEQVLAQVRAGDFGPAYSAATRSAVTDTSDRSFMLDQVKILQLALAEGVPEAADPVAARLYDFLRTQGVNADTTLPSFFVGEGAARIWKGEPFEQAMALSYIAMLDATRGDWGNARASAASALFQVRDFSKALAAEKSANKNSGPSDDRERLLRAAAKEGERTGGDGFESLVTPQASDFELGYVLRALASGESGETADRDEALKLLVQVAPRLKPLAERIAAGPQAGGFNTVLVVDYGLGPRKIRYGPDGALAGFRAVTPSDDRVLMVSVAAAEPQKFEIATDLNRLAEDLRWNNLEDLRLAKSTIGTGLLIAGGVMAAAGRNDEITLAGLGVLLAGAALKSTAGADTRHNELLPQRTYVALLDLPAGNPNIELWVDGTPASRLVLTGLNPPPPGKLTLRYARLPMSAAAWTTSGAVRYANDQTGPASIEQGDLPWILGGRCVRTPSDRVLGDYQRAGHLRGYSLNDLLDLYREEGISIAGITSEGTIGRHILEGGTWLYTPLAGTTGFARLFGVDRPPYQPRSARVREVAARERPATASAPNR